LASRIKQSFPETRAVIMTARCHAEVLQQITSVADGWLFKPFSRDDLRRTLHGLVRGPIKAPIQSKLGASMYE
jgi:DNA-binding NarL/FixJ family response regulator